MNSTVSGSALRRTTSAIAAIAALAVVATGCTAETEAPTSPSPTVSPSPEPFTDEQLNADYASDRTVDYVPILAGFETLQSTYPDVLDENLAMTLKINASATESEEEGAIVDEYGDMSYTMGDALGEHLGALYQDAVDEGRLPKTTALIHKDGGRAQSESTNPAKEYFNYPRPYKVAPDQVVYRDKKGGDAYESTSGSYPSGHTNQAYWQGTLLATLLPELADEILARTSESGNYRVVMAMHYPLDIIGGRMMGQAAIAKRWSDPEFRDLLEEASDELHDVLEADCGEPLEECIADDTPYMDHDEAADIYRERLTYGFDQVGQAGVPMDVPDVAAALLISSHPDLTKQERIEVLELTAIDSGYPLDLSVHSTASWQRIDLSAAMMADVTVDEEGDVHI